MRDECEHGSLRRSCEICERDARIKELEEESMEVRCFLLFNHGHEGQYLDDGELQCSACLPNWDYKRLPLKTLVHHVIARFKAIEEENDRLKAELAILAYLALFHGIISRGRFAELLHIDRADVDEKMAELAEARKVIALDNRA